MTKSQTNWERRIGDLVFWTGRQMLYFAFFCLVVSYTFWAIGINDLTHVAEASLVLLLGLNLGLGIKEQVKLQAKVLAVSLTVLLGVLFVGSFLLSQIYDTTYDGMRAHQASVIALKNGWNPISDPSFSVGLELVKQSDPSPEDADDFHPNENTDSLSKRRELQGNIVVGKGYKVNSFYCLCAVIFSRFNNLESAKSVHLLLLFAAVGITLRYLRSIDTRHAMSIALLISFNPVLLYQLCSFMLDGYTYSLFQIFFFSVLGLFQSAKSKLLWMDVVTSATLLCTAKISGVSYFLAIVGAAFFVLFVTYLSKRSGVAKVRWFLMMLMLLILFNGFYRSYNLRSLVVHDVSISSILDWMMQRDQSRPGLAGIPELAEQNKLQRYLWSNFSITHINPHSYRLKIPGKIEREEIRQLMEGHGEYRTGGFGPLYSAMLLLAFALLLIHPKMLFNKPLILYAIVLIIVSWFSPVWWARWGALQWMIPLLPLILLKREDSTPALFSLKKGIFSSSLLLFAGFCNVALVCSLYSVGRIQTSVHINACVESVDSDLEKVELYYSTFPTNQFWFLSQNIDVSLISLKEANLINSIELHALPATSSKYRVIPR